MKPITTALKENTGLCRSLVTAREVFIHCGSLDTFHLFLPSQPCSSVKFLLTFSHVLIATYVFILTNTRILISGDSANSCRITEWHSYTFSEAYWRRGI